MNLRTSLAALAIAPWLATTPYLPAIAQQAAPAAQAPAAAPALPDETRRMAERSKQDPNLKGNPVPPIATPIDKLPLDKMKVPAGFKVEAFASGLAGARSMLLGPKGTLFVSTRTIGRVYAIKDPFGKKEVKTIATGLTLPNGLAMKDGALYLAANSKVFRFDGIEDHLDDPKPVDISEKFKLPSDTQHGWRFIAFGPDGKLYIPVGANCNICELNHSVYAMIRRYDPDGSNMEIVARGVRNTVGFDWHPVTKELWFTDNGRDWAGNEGPEDELNRLPKDKVGAFFGFPYCHANGIQDPDIRRPEPCAGVVLPQALMGPHAAALGIKFYTGDMFPAKYKNVAFIARHGSWNREKRFGYDLVTATIKGKKVTVEPFLTGLLAEKTNTYHARPVHVLQLPDGSLLLSDEHHGALYRISYDKSQQRNASLMK